ncbi:MAG: hypothetical protein AAGL49_06390, partial [Pseudomonadota bacterium]
AVCAKSFDSPSNTSWSRSAIRYWDWASNPQTPAGRALQNIADNGEGAAEASWDPDAELSGV